MRHDITFPIYVEVDEIYNLACSASTPGPLSMHDPVQTTKTSVIGAINMLGLAKRVGAKILQASTSRGLWRSHRASADARNTAATSTLRCRPRAPVTMKANRCAETLFFDYLSPTRNAYQKWRAFSIPTGRRMHPNDGHAWYRTSLCRRYKARISRCSATGSQTRAFLLRGRPGCRTDAPDGDTKTTLTGQLNIGNPHEIPVRNRPERVIRLTGSRSRTVFKPLPQDESGRSAARTSRWRSVPSAGSPA